MARLLLSIILILHFPGRILFANALEPVSISKDFEVMNDSYHESFAPITVAYIQNHQSSICNNSFPNTVFFNLKPIGFPNSALFIFFKNRINRKVAIVSEGITSTDLKIFPNPFYDRTTIEFNINTKTNVELMIYNVLGKEIIHLKSETMDKGNHKLIWEGTDATGQRIPEGMYLCKLEAEGKTLIKAVYMSKEN